jgi:hypothetical protein
MECGLADDPAPAAMAREPKRKMATLEQQLIAERERTYRHFTVGGFSIAIATLVLLGILGLIFY